MGRGRAALLSQGLAPLLAATIATLLLSAPVYHQLGLTPLLLDLTPPCLTNQVEVVLDERTARDMIPFCKRLGATGVFTYPIQASCRGQRAAGCRKYIS